MENEKARFAGLAGKTATAIINKTEFEKFSYFSSETSRTRAD
jgi:hypothetical protein